MWYSLTIRRAGLVSLAGLYLAATSAHAQSTAPEPLPAAPAAPVVDLSPVSVEALALPVSPELAIEPVDILDGEALIARRTQTLGETLARTPGVSAADFGQGVGRPVIRGLAGARVRVQENGLGSADVSTISQDHAVSIAPYAADKIEVLKGPQTLLYGSGAIGGVVNVVSDRIPDHVPERGIEGQAVLERSDATLGQRLERLDVTAGHGPIAVNLQGTKRLTDDYKANDNQRIDNSATDTSNYSGGTSVVGDWGYVGAAASHFGRNYGIPGEEAQIDLSQNRYDLRGELFEPLAGLSSLEFAAAYTNYRHTEGEAVGPPGAIFDNQTTEFRLAATHETWRDFTGTFGLQGFTRDYKAFGEAETFVPPTTTRSLAAFWVEEHPLGELWMLQGGGAWNIRMKTPARAARTGIMCRSAALSAPGARSARITWPP
ncbi:TonB-dependent receptor plug domain-containing protein [uncultured Salinisphaera sp.]|uniref:TonB-dependent receptor n=1 Tax=uncultured Salinisphaera sp. TaxID=359372 RepID=UPI0032B24778|tara:strand:+ start:9321 stop:10616 length:1296 start_codon:yes stop_codon:yes gene_type:complete